MRWYQVFCFQSANSQPPVLYNGSPSFQFFLYFLYRFAHEHQAANIIAQGVLVLPFSANTSMIVAKRSGISADPWCNPTFTSKYSIVPHYCLHSSLSSSVHVPYHFHESLFLNYRSLSIIRSSRFKVCDISFFPSVVAIHSRITEKNDIPKLFHIKHLLYYNYEHSTFETNCTLNNMLVRCCRHIIIERVQPSDRSWPDVLQQVGEVTSGATLVEDGEPDAEVTHRVHSGWKK